MPVYLLLKAPGTQSRRHPLMSGNAADTGRRYTWMSCSPTWDAALRRAIDAGAQLEQPVQDNAWGKLALLSDPFGHGLCLVQFAGKGYDGIAVDGTTP